MVFQLSRGLSIDTVLIIVFNCDFLEQILNKTKYE